MATLRIQAPDGKTLAIQVAEGTDPAQYDSIVDDVVSHYTQEKQSNPVATMLHDNPAAGEEIPVEQRLASNAVTAGNGVGVGFGVPRMVEGGLSVASKLANSGVAQTIKSAITGGWDALTGNTPRGFGYAQGAGATPEARALAKESISMANEPQEELGKLVNRSQAPANALPPEGGEAAIPAPEEFQTPIRQGILSGKEDMMNAAESQRQQVGKAIENVLSKYDANGTFYDPSAYNNQIKSMLLRDSAGEVMTTGAQGQINEAIKEAGASMGDFSKDGPIKWSDAAKIKTLMQGNGKWGQAGLSRAQEAYNTAATLLKEDIDKQAMEMLQKQGGNVQDYQQLRDAYSKLSSLSESLNVAAKRQFANSAIPWWVKMAAGGMLAGKAASVVKGITGH